MDRFVALAADLAGAGVRFVVIGVWGANYYSPGASAIFSTQDRDLFLPEDPQNLREAWEVCVRQGLELWAGDEPLGEPADLELARKVVRHKALVTASDGRGLEVDLGLVMSGFDFDRVWSERRAFRVEGVEIPVARLAQIVESKANAARPKDRLFLEVHEEAIQTLLKREEVQKP